MKICTNEAEEHTESTQCYRHEINEESEGLFFFFSLSLFLTFLLIIWFKTINSDNFIESQFLWK